MSKELTPRQKAKATGQTRYQGEPCKKCGSSGIRMTSNSNCVECLYASNRRRRAAK